MFFWWLSKAEQAHNRIKMLEGHFKVLFERVGELESRIKQLEKIPDHESLKGTERTKDK